MAGTMQMLGLDQHVLSNLNQIMICPYCASLPECSSGGQQLAQPRASTGSLGWHAFCILSFRLNLKHFRTLLTRGFMTF